MNEIKLQIQDEATMKTYTIWQNYRRNHATPGWAAGHWRRWAATRHVNLSQIEAATQLVEVQDREEELRVKYPKTEAIYEVRVAAR